MNVKPFPLNLTIKDLEKILSVLEINNNIKINKIEEDKEFSTSEPSINSISYTLPDKKAEKLNSYLSDSTYKNTFPYSSTVSQYDENDFCGFFHKLGKDRRKQVKEIIDYFWEIDYRFFK